MLRFRVSEEGSQGSSVKLNAGTTAVILSPLSRDCFVNPSDRDLRELGRIPAMAA
jgi:hypothetical protein